MKKQRSVLIGFAPQHRAHRRFVFSLHGRSQCAAARFLLWNTAPSKPHLRNADNLCEGDQTKNRYDSIDVREDGDLTYAVKGVAGALETWRLRDGFIAALKW